MKMNMSLIGIKYMKTRKITNKIKVVLLLWIKVFNLKIMRMVKIINVAK
jgi:hypothetical protein